MSEELVRSYFAACSNGTASSITEHFTDDAVIYDTNHPPVIGAEAIGIFWDKIRAKWAGAAWFVDTYIGHGDAGAIEWTMTGTHNGSSFAVRGSEHYVFDNGRIAQIRQYWSFDPANPGDELQDYPYAEDDRFA